MDEVLLPQRSRIHIELESHWSRRVSTIDCHWNSHDGPAVTLFSAIYCLCTTLCVSYCNSPITLNFWHELSDYDNVLANRLPTCALWMFGSYCCVNVFLGTHVTTERKRNTLDGEESVENVKARVRIVSFEAHILPVTTLLCSHWIVDDSRSRVLPVWVRALAPPRVLAHSAGFRARRLSVCFGFFRFTIRLALADRVHDSCVKDKWEYCGQDQIEARGLRYSCIGEYSTIFLTRSRQ